MRSQRKHSAACIVTQNNNHLPPQQCQIKKKQCENCIPQKPILSKNATAPVKTKQAKRQVAIQTSNIKEIKSVRKDGIRSASRRVHTQQEESTVPSEIKKRVRSYPRLRESSQKYDDSLQLTDEESTIEIINSRIKTNNRGASDSKHQDSHLKPPVPSHHRNHVRQPNSESGPNIYTQNSEREDNISLDHSTQLLSDYERKLQRSQQELLSTRSRLYQNERKMETMHNEIKKIERDNRLLEEKNKHLMQEIHLANGKTSKYKKIAKSLKTQIEQIEETICNLKKIGQEETRTLQQNIKFLEKAIRQKQNQYSSNLKTITTYLQRLHKMIVPTDQNYSFNIKVVTDLVELCLQLSKLASEEDQRLKESLLQKSYLNEDFNLSQTSNGSEHDPKLMSEKTQRLLDDYERLKYESEHLKAENQKLKETKLIHHHHKDSIQIQQMSTHQNSVDTSRTVVQPEQLRPPFSNFESKESTTNKRTNQSLSVADLLQYDSVSLLNSKLEEKNLYLEDQLNQMRTQMNKLQEQTNELYDEKENFKQQIHSQHSYIISLAAQVPSVLSSKDHSSIQTDEEGEALQHHVIEEQRPFINSHHDQLITQTKRLRQTNQFIADDKLQTQKLYQQEISRNITIRQDEQLSRNSQNESEAESSQPSSRYQHERPPRTHVFESQHHEERKLNQTAGVISFKKTHSFKPPSSYMQSSSEIDSGRRDLQSFRSKQNIFKQNQHYYVEDKKQKLEVNQIYAVESDKENLRGKHVNSARILTDSMSFQGSNNKKHNFVVREESKYQANPSRQSIKSGIHTTMSNSSPLSLVLKKQNLKIENSSTIKRPVSMASTTTLVINEKAKALRDEISTLDSEIQQLQKNLKCAIQNKEKRSSSIR